MILLATDLDNTLIYSYKRQIGEDKLPVELYEGREVSFMTRKSQHLLEELQSEIFFVPLTTRSTAQYERICFSDKFCPTLALTGNGGTLLCNGAEDEEWTNESLRLIEDCQEDLKKVEAFLEQDPARTLDVRRVNDLFVFTKSDTPEDTLARMRAAVPSDQLQMYQNGVKVYAVPKILSKATALKRLQKRLDPDMTLAAGDSLFDIEMLTEADLAFAAPQIAEQVREMRMGSGTGTTDRFPDTFKDAFGDISKKGILRAGVCEPASGQLISELVLESVQLLLQKKIKDWI